MEERTVSHERDPQIFGGNVITLHPLSLQRGAFTRKHVGQPGHHLGHQRIGLFNGGTGLIDEAGLDRLPLRPISDELLLRKQIHLARVVRRRRTCRHTARNVCWTIRDSRPVARPVIDTRAIDESRTIVVGAAVTRDGSLDWLRLPRFESPSIFRALLHADRGGRSRVRPSGPFRSVRRNLAAPTAPRAPFPRGGPAPQQGPAPVPMATAVVACFVRTPAAQRHHVGVGRR